MCGDKDESVISLWVCECEKCDNHMISECKKLSDFRKEMYGEHRFDDSWLVNRPVVNDWFLWMPKVWDDCLGYRRRAKIDFVIFVMFWFIKF